MMVESKIFLAGTPVMIDISRASGIKGHTFFRGHKEGHYLILDLPNDEDGAALALKDEMPCIVRFLFQGKVYAFQSEILRVIRYPYPFIFIPYPQELNSINLREVERYSVRIAATFSEQAMERAGKENYRGTLIDLSDKGCLLEAEHSFNIDTLLFLAFNLPNEEPILNLACKVRRISKKEAIYHLGLQFLVSEDPDIEKINRYLSYLEGLRIQA
jgi:c-di-GMP-binding flagellar brake protein YcgR